jgi:hypothetical protein
LQDADEDDADLDYDYDILKLPAGKKTISSLSHNERAIFEHIKDDCKEESLFWEPFALPMERIQSIRRRWEGQLDYGLLDPAVLSPLGLSLVRTLGPSLKTPTDKI